MFTFRTSIALAVMTFVVALAALLIAIQVRSLSWATHEAASAYMDAASTKALGRLHGELNTIASLMNVLATSSSVADSNERSETGRAIPLFKAALQEMPHSIYIGFENGAWLQVRRISDLGEDQRDRLRAPASSDIVVNLVRHTPAGDLPMRRIFQDRQGNEVSEIDLWNYGYDARTRPWYRQTMRLDGPFVTAPYLAFSIGAPVITVSAPLRGKVPGALAADLKLDTFSDFVQAQRPGPHGVVMIFDQADSLIAHPDFAEFVARAMTRPSRLQLPNIAAGTRYMVWLWIGGVPEHHDRIADKLVDRAAFGEERLRQHGEVARRLPHQYVGIGRFRDRGKALHIREDQRDLLFDAAESGGDGIDAAQVLKVLSPTPAGQDV